MSKGLDRNIKSIGGPNQPPIPQPHSVDINRKSVLFSPDTRQKLTDIDSARNSIRNTPLMTGISPLITPNESQYDNDELLNNVKASDLDFMGEEIREKDRKEMEEKLKAEGELRSESQRIASIALRRKLQMESELIKLVELKPR